MSKSSEVSGNISVRLYWITSRRVWKFRHVAGRTMGTQGPAGCRCYVHESKHRERKRERERKGEREREREKDIGAWIREIEVAANNFHKFRPTGLVNIESGMQQPDNRAPAIPSANQTRTYVFFADLLDYCRGRNSSAAPGCTILMTRCTCAMLVNRQKVWWHHCPESLPTVLLP